MKNILQRENQKRDKKIQHKHMSHWSLKWNSEKSQEWGGCWEGGNEYIYIYIYI